MRVNYNSDISAIISDVGLRRICAYYRTSACAMCLRKCVRIGFGTVRAGIFSTWDVQSHFLPWLIRGQTILRTTMHNMT